MTTTDAAAKLHAQLEASLNQLVTSDDWLATLEIAAKFHNYSFANVMLIRAEAQRRDITPTRVAGYRKWQELGRHVRRGEKGIPILAPMITKVRDTEPDQPPTPDTTSKEERRLVGFRVVHVFDISQTDGPPLPEVTPVRVTGDLPQQWNHLAQLIEDAGYTLRDEDPQKLNGANGVTYWDHHHVALRSDLSGAQRFKTAAHELAHIRLHDPQGGERPTCRGVIEVEAESVAYIISAAAGIDTASYSIPYVATWANGNPALVTQTAQRVIDCATAILPALEHTQQRQPPAPDRTRSRSAPPSLVRDAIDADRARDPGALPAVDDGSMFTIDTPDHGPVLTQNGGCASCGADPTHLVIYDRPNRSRNRPGWYAELACEPHAQRAHRGGAMTYPHTIIPAALIARARRQAQQHLTDTETLLQRAISHYQGWLHGPKGEPARRYLTQRGITEAIAEQFQLGYAPPTWRTLTDGLRHDGYTPQQLLASGTVARARTGHLYDTLRGRLIFPIHDHQGQPRGFAGRLIEGDGPKYLNTAATALYKKGELLYGHHHAHSAIIEHGEAIIVEGYTDVLACQQVGITNTVAPGGTAISQHHLATLRRTTHNITLALDGDSAGARAAGRVHDLANTLNLNIQVAALPQGRDPADLLTTGDTHAFREAVKDAVPLPIYVIDQAINQHTLEDTESAWHAIRDASAIVIGIAHPELRATAADHVALRLGWEPGAVRRGLVYHLSESVNAGSRHPSQERTNDWSIGR